MSQARDETFKNKNTPSEGVLRFKIDALYQFSQLSRKDYKFSRKAIVLGCHEYFELGWLWR
ncbi:hypothetical protein F7734_32920 [Scytonema sp. UIC 10036]|uniref:hypothetical protein n=1 Tax=Scytonema sp. UIC 10036 TaxID=2304196 RepID=UPI0012DABBBF|nr:hypothetical protein [Scytonema sp. UIC 10036]MUG96888.1 hypothetical protein [Scytonema sp. UIC 10036]